MIVLINCLSSISGGAVSYLRNLLPLLHGKFSASGGRDQLLVLAHESQRQIFPELPQSACHIVTGKRQTGLGRLFWEHRNLNKLAKLSNADVLFVPYQIAPVNSGIRQVLMLRNMEPFHYHQYKYELKEQLRNAMLKVSTQRSLRKANRIIAVSQYAESHLTNVLGIPKERIRTVYHGRNPYFANRANATCDTILLNALGIGNNFILTCGSLLPYRRCEDVIHAFSCRPSEQREDCQLVIAGSGNDRRYRKLIDEAILSSGCANKIVVLGHVNQEIMAALYRCCSLCVIASEVEACPNIAIEAMTSGAVIVASDSPPLPEIFAGAALHFQSRNKSALVEAMTKAINDEKLRIELQQLALKRAQYFSWQHCAEETFRALTEW